LDVKHKIWGERGKCGERKKKGPSVHGGRRAAQSLD